MKNTEGKGENCLWKTNIFLEEKKKGKGKGVKYHGRVKYLFRRRRKMGEIIVD